jgi:hypothetical protein
MPVTEMSEDKARKNDQRRDQQGIGEKKPYLESHGAACMN